MLLITAFASADSAVEAMKLGAYDYLSKPFQVDEVQLIVRNALEKRRLSTENTLLKREIASQSSFAPTSSARANPCRKCSTWCEKSPTARAMS